MKKKLLPLIVIVAAFLIAALMSLTKPDSLELESPIREVAVKDCGARKVASAVKGQISGYRPAANQHHVSFRSFGYGNGISATI